VPTTKKSPNSGSDTPTDVKTQDDVKIVKKMLMKYELTTDLDKKLLIGVFKRKPRELEDHEELQVESVNNS